MQQVKHNLTELSSQFLLLMISQDTVKVQINKNTDQINLSFLNKNLATKNVHLLGTKIIYRTSTLHQVLPKTIMKKSIFQHKTNKKSIWDLESSKAIKRACQSLVRIINLIIQKLSLCEHKQWKNRQIRKTIYNMNHLVLNQRED